MPTVFITIPVDNARKVAEGLLEERLAACVNHIDCHSQYWWDGQIVEDKEVILLAKTTVKRYEGLVEYVEEHHPYDVPCIERFDESDVLDSYSGWRSTVTKD